MRQAAIICHTSWNPVGLVCIAALVLPFALNGGAKGVVLAVIVWVAVARLLVRWWRGRNDPKPPSHAV